MFNKIIKVSFSFRLKSERSRICKNHKQRTTSIPKFISSAKDCFARACTEPVEVLTIVDVRYFVDKILIIS